MKKLVSLCWVIVLLTTFTKGQANKLTTVDSKKVAKSEYSEVDFFKDQKKLFCWSGPISTSKTQRGIASLPLMEYNDLSIGLCRIISYPKAGLAAWESIIKPIHALEDQHQEVRKISLYPKIQQNYNIYAFFVEAKNLVPFPDPGDPNAREPRFPCPVYIYKREAQKWLLLRTANIKDFRDFAELKFVTVTNNTK